ncbi:MULTISPECIES: hypothetical protein [unclassified Bradyrhizobium]|uniref:hypothetical protein n=1 Tax=unclassified Bradyrhizobium TaxID=2631580 RepID=UPI001BA98D14|nr:MULTISPECIES: hypothetical protein [unclassified Bradyrhizobium]MBR1223666.1 hypothetical protein [Bradyrhizobium sp. AUGA SZCCT0176]MBR1296271.1 hypothetical protein [Bradyrhizobium sp. AUGA SZCCT0042]
MIRVLAVALILSCSVTPAWAQAQPAPIAAPSAPKPAKKAAAKTKTSARQAAPTESGPCQIGVIPAVGDQFAVQKIGLTVFNNDYADVPIESWGLDDLVVARVRAVTGSGAGVRRIAYSKQAFAPYDRPAPALFRNPESDLTTIVRQITANAGCARYVAVTKLDSKLDGTNQTLRGIGVYHRGIGSLVGHTRLYSNIQVTVFDGQTYEVSKKPFNLNLGLALARGFGVEDPLTKLENSAFPEPAAAAATSATLRDGTRALLATHLDKALSATLGQ